jgi:hypothetical protein
MEADMKYFIIVLFIYSIAFSQSTVTDSVRWVPKVTDGANSGNKECKHEWKWSGKIWNGDAEGKVLLTDRICSVCGKYQVVEQVIYEHYLADEPKTGYDVAKEKMRDSELTAVSEITVKQLQILINTGKAIEAKDEKGVEEPSDITITSAVEEPIEELIEP